MSDDVCIHRAPGTCCPEPSCDHRKDRGLIQKVGTVRKNGSARRGVWELTERARRISR